MTNFGTHRRLQRLTTEAGHLCVLALDHRDALRTEFSAEDPESVPASVLKAFKADVLAGVGDRASAVMLEPEYSVPHLTSSRAVPASVGVFCALEAQGYNAMGPDGSRASNDFMADWSVDALVRTGADGAKILILYRHDQGEHTEAQDRFIAEAVRQAAEANVPILVEPVPYDLAGADDRRTVIIEAAKRIAPLGPMILKMPFPGEGACAELDAACNPHPWALLSWGVPYAEFRDQLSESVANGCSGFAVGRALWREALPEAQRANALRDVVVPRFEELATIAANGRPVWDRMPAPIVSAQTWPYGS